MRYTIQIPKDNKETTALGFSGKNPKTGETLGVTNKCFTKNGAPWFPVMGEFHYSRYPNQFWEEEILKMKTGGITVIASYIFWVHHEEIEGEFDWTGDRALRQFINLCQKHEMKMVLRLGPWSHGECRHGGFPDWLLKKGIELRSDNPGYLACVDALYGEIWEQAKGHLYKDGGCIIGIQLENEYGHCGGFRGQKGHQHMSTLKKIAVEKGFDVPYYTATGWGGAVVVEDEMLPVLGAYADAPWDRSLSELPANENFVYSHVLNDESIGSDFKKDIAKRDTFTYDPYRYPYATAELGGGIQVTKRRRPVVSALDTQAMIYSKFGSGSNLIGYYMYHGGTNPRGKLTTLQETTAVGNYCDLPILSYDFQAPVGEYGELHQSYRYLKMLHMMVNDFGEIFADAVSYIPPESGKKPEDMESLRFSFLKNDTVGLLCLNNHQRRRRMTDKKDIEISVDGIQFPVFDLLDGMSIVFPFIWDLGGAVIDFVTAQPLCKIEEDDAVSLFFWNYCQDMQAGINGQSVTIKQNEPYKFEILGQKKVALILLSREQAENAWKVNMSGQDSLIITKAGVMNPDGNIVLYDVAGDTEVLFYPRIKGECEPNGIFSRMLVSPPKAAGKTAVEYDLICGYEGKDGGISYRIYLPEEWEDTGDAFLCIDFEGDIANLYYDGERIADWFYTGLEWRVGLKKFAGMLNRDLILRIEPLKEDATVYLEIYPEYEDHTACRLKNISLDRKYTILI